MNTLNRRQFLSHTAAAGTVLALQGLVARGSAAATEYHHLVAGKGSGGYGPLHPAKAKNTGETLLALPEGFEYTAFGKTGSMMSDGNPTPRMHDGMAAFDVNGKIHLVRNHEINSKLATNPTAFGDKSKAYDELAGGGTTTLVVDPKTRELIKDWASLSGTLQNCAGGPTPWGTWITCEETVLGRQKLKEGSGKDGGVDVGGFNMDHGYCFEVSAANEGMTTPVALREMGRFVHEAVAVDPATGIVYETEDRGTSGFYRYIPHSKGKLAGGGRLQMLAIKGQDRYDTRKGQKTGVSLPAVWVDIADPDPKEAETDSLAVFKQGAAKGGATFARLEGCWHGEGRIFINATTGGDKILGQVWEYRPVNDKEGALTLLFESPSADLLDMPDNLCVSPRGGLVLCEDGKLDQFVRGLTKDGRIFDFAKNIVPGASHYEFAGCTFSPDGETLFFNIQTPGITFAVWGPWKDGAL